MNRKPNLDMKIVTGGRICNSYFALQNRLLSFAPLCEPTRFKHFIAPYNKKNPFGF